MFSIFYIFGINIHVYKEKDSKVKFAVNFPKE